mmetsp:Transcript_6315/g.23810  ORF Transcript_6315/g.23810 Transcript_6315/m.23810 type:complete len:406 (-) Transcript_6315:3062-4279(-)
MSPTALRSFCRLGRASEAAFASRAASAAVCLFTRFNSACFSSSCLASAARSAARFAANASTLRLFSSCRVFSLSAFLSFAAVDFSLACVSTTFRSESCDSFTAFFASRFFFKFTACCACAFAACCASTTRKRSSLARANFSLDFLTFRYDCSAVSAETGCDDVWTGLLGTCWGPRSGGGPKLPVARTFACERGDSVGDASFRDEGETNARAVGDSFFAEEGESASSESSAAISEGSSAFAGDKGASSDNGSVSVSGDIDNSSRIAGAAGRALRAFKTRPSSFPTFGETFSRTGSRGLRGSVEIADVTPPPRPFSAAFFSNASRFTNSFAWMRRFSASNESAASRAASSRSRSRSPRFAAICEISNSRFALCAASAARAVGFAGLLDGSEPATNCEFEVWCVPCES